MASTRRQPTKPDLIPERDKAALIVVDMQNASLSDEGSTSKLSLDNTHLKQTLAPVKRLVQACHQARIPVVFTRYVLKPDYTGAGLFLDLFPAIKEVEHLAAGTWDSELHAGLPVGPADHVIEKSRYSAFFGTNLDVMLQQLGVDTLIVCGITTEICVESTVRDAFARDYKTLVAEDAVASDSLDRHRGALRTIEYGFGTVAHSNEIIMAIRGSHGKRARG